MGYDVESAKDIRISEYYRTEPAHGNQDKAVLTAVSCYKQGVGASYLYKKHFNERYPLTSIRRSLNTLFNEGRLEEAGKVKSELYNSSEMSYKIKPKQESLF